MSDLAGATMLKQTDIEKARRHLRAADPVMRAVIDAVGQRQASGRGSRGDTGKDGILRGHYEQRRFSKTCYRGSSTPSRDTVLES